MVGIYIHVPFCDGKCPYCDFYSLRGDNARMEAYTAALCARLASYGGKGVSAATVYFGGGTPNLLGAERLGRILSSVRSAFSLSQTAEITLEANPTHTTPAFFREVRQAGFNRLSLGLQSADENELRFLGRRHSPADVRAAVEAARAAGFENLSVDLMLGLPGGSRQALQNSVAFAAGLGPRHISAYILKIEPGTPFAARGLSLPDDDLVAEEYLFLAEELERRGYTQYEISNFAVPGWESRHNLLYWQGEEYLGFGPGAHSFYRGERFYYPRDLDAFLAGAGPVSDGPGGDFAEYAMLSLRLAKGLQKSACRKRYGQPGEEAFQRCLGRAKKLPPEYLRADEDGIAFTRQGFLVSNALLGRLLE